jgi:hypothetical protein
MPNSSWYAEPEYSSLVDAGFNRSYGTSDP